MQPRNVRCHGCGRIVPLGPDRRVGVREVCDACGADLHACRQCAHHDPGAYNECRESGAERVLDKQRANHCDHFRPGEGRGSAEVGAADDAARARAELERLFRR